MDTYRVNRTIGGSPREEAVVYVKDHVATRLRSNLNLPFSNRTQADQAKLDAAVLRALEAATYTIGGQRPYSSLSRGDVAIAITLGMLGVTHATIDQIAPLVSASCKRLIQRGLVVEGARRYAREGRPA
jgi:hypothetical protein